MVNRHLRFFLHLAMNNINFYIIIMNLRNNLKKIKIRHTEVVQKYKMPHDHVLIFKNYQF